MAIKIVAGGGIIENDEKEILLQLRKGKWDLPKGKLEDGEAIEACAVREVEEETGLKEIELRELIGTTIHTYCEKGQEIQKETHWFSMKAPGHQQLIPQVEEDILELRWVRKDELKNYLSNTFKNIIEILDKYYEDKKSI